MKKILRISLIVIAVSAFAGFFVYLALKDKKSPETYEIKSPSITNIVQKTVATGTVLPDNEILIKPQESGIIDEIYIEPGQMVKKGDLIAKIRIVPDMLAVSNAESQLKQAILRLKDAEQVYERQKKIHKQGVISDADFQTVETSYLTAREQKSAAENHLQLIKEGITKNSSQESNTLIRSTIEGMVLDVPIEVGNSVIKTNTFNEGTTIASVADMGQMIFEGKIDETEVGKISEGMDLMLTIGAINDYTFHAELEFISPKGVEENGAVQFEIKARIALNDSVFIRAGYSATANIVLAQRDSVLAVNEGLLRFNENNHDSVYVEVETGEQKFEKRYIKTGLSDGINIEVLEGVSLQDKIKGEKI